MENSFIIQLFVIICGFIVLGYLLRRWITASSKISTSEQLVSELLKSLDNRSFAQSQEIREQTKSLNDRLDNAARVIAQVQKNIGEFSEIGRSMRDLQAFLKSPKLRGNVGEEILADLVGQLFPRGSFFLQHAFKSGVRVDVAIKTRAGILPVDAKFPLENYQLLLKSETESERAQARKNFARDIKKHIEDIAQKYILPDEGTLDFALMYVPSETVFYELVQLTEVMNFARKKMVYPVSPTTLYAHLQTILLSFAGQQMEKKTRDVLATVRTLQIDFEKVSGQWTLLGKHLTHAYRQMSDVDHELASLGQTIQSTKKLGLSASSELLEK